MRRNANGAALLTFLPELLPRAQTWYQRLTALDAEAGFGPQGRARLRQVPFPVFLRTMISLLAGFMLTERVIKPDRLPQFADIDWPEALVDVFLHGVLKPPDRDGEGAAGT